MAMVTWNLVVGTKIEPDNLHQGGLYWLENTGTATAPAFQLRGLLHLEPAFHYAPALGDLMATADPDLVLGQFHDAISWYHNDGSGPDGPRFSLVDSAIVRLPHGSNAVPTLVDIDGDGDLDLFVGESSGRVLYFRNDGTPGSPRFSLITDDFLGEKPGRRTAPRFTDLFGDGLQSLVVGTERGLPAIYRNVGTRSAPRFVPDTTVHLAPTLLDTRLCRSPRYRTSLPREWWRWRRARLLPPGGVGQPLTRFGQGVVPPASPSQRLTAAREPPAHGLPADARLPFPYDPRRRPAFPGVMSIPPPGAVSPSPAAVEGRGRKRPLSVSSPSWTQELKRRTGEITSAGARRRATPCRPPPWCTRPTSGWSARGGGVGGNDTCILRGGRAGHAPGAPVDHARSRGRAKRGPWRCCYCPCCRRIWLAVPNARWTSSTWMRPGGGFVA